MANKDQLAFWKSVFPDALPASALAGEGIVQLTQVVRDQMLGRTMRSQIRVPLQDAKGIGRLSRSFRTCGRGTTTRKSRPPPGGWC